VLLIGPCSLLEGSSHVKSEESVSSFVGGVEKKLEVIRKRGRLRSAVGSRLCRK
jgi:hypothetical protein